MKTLLDMEYAGWDLEQIIWNIVSIKLYLNHVSVLIHFLQLLKDQARIYKQK